MLVLLARRAGRGERGREGGRERGSAWGCHRRRMKLQFRVSIYGVPVCSIRRGLVAPLSVPIAASGLQGEQPLEREREREERGERGEGRGEGEGEAP